MSDNKFPMLAKTFRGLEDVLRDELIALGAENVEIGNRMVTFEGDNEMMYKANFCLRTALRILKPIIKFRAADPDELYDTVREIDWSKYLDEKTSFSIDSTVNSSAFNHSQYVTYRVKDAIVDHFNDRYGKRPAICVGNADLIFNVHIDGDRVTISLDSSGESLNKRGYRLDDTGAPLNEVLAAGIILKTGWRGDSNFVDPMCGSGTFLIEAALIAANINPGIFRNKFAFERWKDFDKELFAKISSDDSAEREFKHHIYGADINPKAVTIAANNIRAAHVENMVTVRCQAFEDWTEAPQAGILVTNPPYGERMKPDDIGDFYHNIGATLKRCFAGYNAWILGYKDEHFAAIGLKPSVKFPVLNGALECSLREYVLFDGKYDDFKRAGGSVQNADFDRTVKPRTHRPDDKQWDKEAARFDGKSNQHRRKNDKNRGPKKDFKKKDYGHKDSRRRDDFKRGDEAFRSERPYRSRPAVDVQAKTPRISAEGTAFSAGAKMRSRRGWKKTDSDTPSVD